MSDEDGRIPIGAGTHWWCARHLEPFRKDWPKGYALAMVSLFQMGASDELIGAQSLHYVGGLQAALDSHAPLCCYLREEKVLAMVESSLSGELYFDPEWPETMRPKGRPTDGGS